MTHEGQGIYVLPLYYISLSAKCLYHNTVTRFYKVTHTQAHGRQWLPFPLYAVYPLPTVPLNRPTDYQGTNTH